MGDVLEQFGHGGDLVTAAEKSGLDPTQILDFSANINPQGPPPSVMEVIELRSIVHYPDPDQRNFRSALAAQLGIGMDKLLIGNGAAECMALAMLAFAPQRVGVVYPCFSEYTQLAEQFEATEIRGVYGREELGFQPDLKELGQLIHWADLVFIGHPNNPTGTVYCLAELKALAEQAAQDETYLIIDEAFLDFLPESEQETLLDQLDRYPTTVIIRSLTKMYAIPGLRLGYAVAASELIVRMKGKQVTWSVNTLALAAGKHCLAEQTYVARTRSLVGEQRERLKTEIKQRLGWQIWSGRANFLLVRLPAPLTALELQTWLLERGILIRNCAMYPGLGAGDFRIAVLDQDKNERLLAALSDFQAQRGEKE
ncbi:threonine-phosphate decarboxylase [Ammoniphilus oxalaticus]|uniref:threonine-phosphate decarboxylase n=1 Tax=Ammoniphilus oxalaticus TaxID=66863 RepID=A0A419SLI3_9BACL|nr:threonine-phosphate decarboxylase CobD [Ammoniphilus oxalaticus]RKD24940.1 threonine-phosphate decarboxylase [Ammoniphilus oxalaticus]